MERPSIIISYKYNPSILQLTILNERGRIWTMVAGGGASVIYADTIVDMGGVNELANYGKSIYCLCGQYSKMKNEYSICATDDHILIR